MVKIENQERKGIILMILSSFFVAFGQLGWKLSQGVINIYIVFGFLLYGIGALLMLVAYKYGRLSILQPILSLSYIMSLFLGGLFLHEVVSWNKILGVFCIMIGIFLITRRTF